MDIKICERPLILELLSCKDETLLIWRDALLVLNLRLYVRDSIARLNLERDRLASQSLYENLHSLLYNRRNPLIVRLADDSTAARHVHGIAEGVAAALCLELHQKVYKQDKYKCVEEQTRRGRAAIGSNPGAKEPARQFVRLGIRHQKENEAGLERPLDEATVAGTVAACA